MGCFMHTSKRIKCRMFKLKLLHKWFVASYMVGDNMIIQEKDAIEGQDYIGVSKNGNYLMTLRELVKIASIYSGK